MSNELTPSIFDGEIPLFEQKARYDTSSTWSARDLADWLGYTEFNLFRKVLTKAQEVLVTLGIDVSEHFNQEITQDERGRSYKDTRLSRTACYLCAMSGNNKKAQVAAAQMYFARFSEACQRYLDDGEPIERVLIRREVSKHERMLSQTAIKAGATDFGKFRNAGYRGLYDMNLDELKKLKGIPEDRTPLDFMGKDELAANLFQNTQTEAKIKSENIRGQTALEATAEHVGKAVRNTMWNISKQRPERLATQDDIKKVKVTLKRDAIVLKLSSPSDLPSVPAKDTYLEAPEE